MTDAGSSLRELQANFVDITFNCLLRQPVSWKKMPPTMKRYGGYMAYLTWRREWDTGIAVIDKQHCRIVELINELHQARENGGGREAVAEVLRDLVDYTATHFSFEEELQAQAGYPFARAHKRLHEMFIKKVAGYQEKFAAGEDIVLEVLSTMEKWLIHHIKGDDADYVSLVRERLFADGNSSPGWLGGMLGKFFNTKEA